MNDPLALEHCESALKDATDERDRYKALLQQTMSDHHGGHSPCHCVEISRVIRGLETRPPKCSHCGSPRMSDVIHDGMSHCLDCCNNTKV